MFSTCFTLTIIEVFRKNEKKYGTIHFMLSMPDTHFRQHKNQKKDQAIKEVRQDYHT